MTTLEQIIDQFSGMDLLKADGLDDAVIGICFATQRLIYDVDKCVRILMERDGMGADEAMEFLAFNTFGAYVGEQTPIWAIIPPKEYGNGTTEEE